MLRLNGRVLLDQVLNISEAENCPRRDQQSPEDKMQPQSHARTGEASPQKKQNTIGAESKLSNKRQKKH